MLDDVSIARFWGNVDRRSPQECWPWRGAVDRDGYGRFRRGIRGKKYCVGAHRYSLAIHHRGFPPPEIVAMHKCDNPVCVNPHHLRWGTQAENVKDAAAKGRAARARSQNRLSATDVVGIRQSSLSNHELSKRYRVSRSSIIKIKKRENWKCLP